MKTLIPVVAIVMFCCLTGCQSTAPEPEPPVAAVQPKVFEEFGHERVDDYYWLNQREDPEVLAYLEAENAYADAKLAHTDALQQTLFDEIVGRIKKDDNTVPVFENGWWYYTRYEEGKEYPIHCRKEGTLEADERILLDVNAMAPEGDGYFAVRGAAVSSDNTLLAWAEDDVGRRIYSIRFKNLVTGEIYDDVIEGASGNLEWAEDDRTLFYSRKDLQTLRTDRIFRHELGDDSENDALVYREDDETFGVYVYKTRSKRFMMIVSYQSVSTEYRFLDATDPTGEFRVLQPRERDHEYSVSHLDDHFYIVTNWNARNFRLMTAPVDAPAKENWTEAIPHREDVLLQGIDLFRDWMVVSERREGLRHLRVFNRLAGTEHELEFGEQAYLAFTTGNPELDTYKLRYVYESPTTPRTTYEYDMNTREKTILKRQEVLGGYSPDDYACERFMAPARDGVQVPVTVVYRKGFAADGTAPLVLYGYGSYGSSMEPRFSSARLSLLDRGVVWAIAHVRGGEEMGRRWYEDGKLFNKKNTFRDFIDVGKHLVAEGYADPEHLYAMGGSAGGLLTGAVINMEPDLFKGVVSQVPFVDVVTTMLDPSIPLTTGEYDEWGDPNEKDAYEYILSYSPYDNVESKAYPSMLVTTGLHDSQVQYWEPAKWVAKLRALKTDDNTLLLKTNMEAGHGGASGRFRRHKETALEYAFLLDLAGVAE